MNSKIAKTLLAATAVVLVLAVVAMAAYHFGANNMGFDRHPGLWPMMRDRSGQDGMGGGLFGLVALLLVGLGVAVFVAMLLGWGRSPSEIKPPSDGSGTAPGTTPPSAAAPGSAPVTADTIAQLKELSDLHDRGALTDEEFAAAKRRLLGL